MKEYNIPLEYYRIFSTVAEHSNVTKAAEVLFLTQPSVSIAISKMESRLGCKLFFRSSKGVTLTREGELLYSYVSKAMNLLDVGESKYRDMQNLRAGEIRIGASDTLSGGYLLPYLKTFYSNYPEISLKVTNRTTYETVTLLKSGTIDLGFVNLPIVSDDSLEVFECMEIHDCLVCGEKYSFLAKSGLALRDIADYPLILLEKASNTRLFIDDYAMKNNTSLSPIIELGSSELLLQFAAVNIGLTFAVKEFTGSKIDNVTLFKIPLDPEPPARHIGMIKLKGIPFSTAANRFIELLKER